MYTKYQTVIEPVDTYAENDKQFTHSRAGDVLVPASGETAADIARASTILYSGIIIGGDINIIEPKANEWDSIFLALDITYGKIKGELIKRAQGKSIVHLHNADLKTLSIYHPSLKEQQKISKLIMTVDNLIAANQRQQNKPWKDHPP